MKSKVIGLFLIITILANLCGITPISVFADTQVQPVHDSEKISVYLDQEKITFDVAPIIESGRTLVPVRAIFEAMNMDVSWDETTSTVTAVGNGDTISLVIDRTDAVVNGRTYHTDVPARILNGRTLVPVRFISESLRTAVEWDDTNKIVNIFSGRISDHRTRTNPATYSSVLTYEKDGTKTSLGDVTFDFSYSDQYFVSTGQNDNGYGYNHDLLRASLALNVSSWPPEASLTETNNTDAQTMEARTEHLRTFYDRLHLENFEQHNYEKSLYNAEDSTAYSFASKVLYDGSVLVTVAIRGASYGAEWRSNFHVGSKEFHQGFYLPAKSIYQDLEQYLNKHNYNKDTTKIWLTGFSRAGAIGNLLAGMVNDNQMVLPEHLYAYLFAVPNTVNLSAVDATNEKYANIKNILLPHDMITEIPFDKWNWGRYGVTLTVKDTEPHPDDKHVAFFQTLTQNKVDYTATPDTVVRVNQLINSLMEIIPTQEAYQPYQDFVMDLAEWGLFRAPYSNENLKSFINLRYGSDKRMADAELFFANEIKPVIERLSLLTILFVQYSVLNDPLVYDAIYQATILMYVNGLEGGEIKQLLLQIVSDLGGYFLAEDGGFFGANSIGAAHNSEYYIAWMFSYDNGNDIYQTFPF